MKEKIIACLTLVVSLCFGTANGETIEIDNVVTTAGSIVSVNVTASSTTGGSLGSLDAPLDFGVVGPGGQAGFTFLGANQVQTFDNFTTGLNPSSAEDHLQSAIVFSAANAINLTSPATLYTLDFSVASSVPAGTVFDIRILDGGTFDGNPTSFQVFDENFAQVPSTAIDGSITIAAVPEPASTTIVLLAGISLATVRRRRG